MEETQKALLEKEEKDTVYNWSSESAWFQTWNKTIERNGTSNKTSFDFQVLDDKQASQLEHLKNIGLENLLKNEPRKYISDRLSNGTIEQ